MLSVIAHRAVESLLESATGTRARVVRAETLAEARGLVQRLTFDVAIDGIGMTVITKQRDLGDGNDAYVPINLATERTALDLIRTAGANAGPVLIAGGEADGLIVMTDVGTDDVGSLLIGDDPGAAEDALVALARCTARLNRIRYAPGVFDGIDTWTIASRVPGWDDVDRACETLAFPRVSPAADREHTELMVRLRTPGPSHGLIHGDLTPQNGVIGDDGVCRLVDFEGSCFHHTGIDAAMLRFPFAWYGKWAEMPDTVQQAMEDAYRDELGKPAHEVDHDIAAGCMGLVLLRLERIPRIADERQEPGLAMRRRSQIVSTIDTATAAAWAVDAFPALTSWLVDLADAMRERWPEARVKAPYYPVFAVAGRHSCV